MTLSELLTDYQQGRNEGGDFETGIRMAVQGILVNPEFAFRFEHVPAGVAPGSELSYQRLRVGFPFVVFPCGAALPMRSC